MSVSLTLHEIARALRGKVVGRCVIAAGPGHSSRDTSLLIDLSDTLPDGFRVHSFSGDDWRVCRDHVADALGLPRDSWREKREPDRAEMQARRDARRRAQARERAEEAKRTRRVWRIWNASRPIGDDLTSAYLSKWRRLECPDTSALRFHPSCAWEEGVAPCMVAALRDIATGDLCGLHRTRLDPDTAEKRDRKMYGRSRGAAIMINTLGTSDILHIAEGIETALAGRQHFGLRPIWALGSSGAVAAFPLIETVKHLVVVGENDPNGASRRATEAVGNRWYAAGRTVEIVWPPAGFKDLNDAVMGGVSA